MDENVSTSEKKILGRFSNAFVIKLLVVYSVSVSVACALLLGLFISTTSPRDALQQQSSLYNDSSRSNSTYESCEEVRSELERCNLWKEIGQAEAEAPQVGHASDTEVNGTVGLQSKLDECKESKKALESKCESAAVDNTMLRETNAAVNETNAQLITSLEYMQEIIDSLNASIVACNLSSEELLGMSQDWERQFHAIEASAKTLNETLQSYLNLTNELTEENNKLERLNAVQREEITNLTASNAELTETNLALNESLVEARRLENDLSLMNRRYMQLNAELNETSKALAAEVDELEATAAALNATAMEYSRLNDELSDNVDKLTETNEDLTVTVAELNSTVAALTGQNDRLTNLNNDLGSIASFLDETANGVEETYVSLAAYLSEQISQYRGLLIETLANTYRQRTYYWICAMNSRFAGEPFRTDASSPIGIESYFEVVDYVEEIILANLCLDVDDFEQAVASSIGPTRYPMGVTYNFLIRSVQTYVADAIEYYFPADGEEGLGEMDWAEAGYRCENLPREKQF